MQVEWYVSLIQAFVIINPDGERSRTDARRAKGHARMQLRYGPNRQGRSALLQPIADLLQP